MTHLRHCRIFHKRMFTGFLEQQRGVPMLLLALAVPVPAGHGPCDLVGGADARNGSAPA